MSIRTTVTLDEDVYERLKQESRAREIPFRQAINEVIRTGLLADRRPAPRKRFKVKPVNMGLRPDLNYDNIGELLEQIEGPLHR